MRTNAERLLEFGQLSQIYAAARDAVVGNNYEAYVGHLGYAWVVPVYKGIVRGEEGQAEPLVAFYAVILNVSHGGDVVWTFDADKYLAAVAQAEAVVG